MARYDFGASLSETIEKVQRLSRFGHVPFIQGGILPLPSGEYELIHAAPMRIPPRLSFEEQTGKYVFEVTHNDEISTRFRAISSKSGTVVTHPIPLRLVFELDAEL